MNKYICFILPIVFTISACKDYPEPFTLMVGNETDLPVFIKIAFWNFQPEPKPSGMYKDEEFSIWNFYCNMEAGSKESYRLKGTSFGSFDCPNEALRYEIAEITFLDNNGKVIQSFDARYQALIIPQGRPDAGMNEWEFPSRDRPFYLELDKDGKIGRIIITDTPFQERPEKR